MVKNFLGPVYTIYAALVFALLGLILASPIVLLWPTMPLRRKTALLTMRLFMLFTGMRLTINGIDNLPASTAVVTANHCSYIDGPILNAVLPARYGFVIKRDDTANVPFLGFFLARLGAVFVERYNRKAAMRDGQKMIQTLREGTSLGIFPEGGILPGNNLKPFKKGAFLAAARVNIPVVPVVIKGTAEVLPSGSWQLWPGHIRVTIHPPLHPQASSSDAIKELRDRTFEIIARDI